MDLVRISCPVVLSCQFVANVWKILYRDPMSFFFFLIRFQELRRKQSWNNSNTRDLEIDVVIHRHDDPFSFWLMEATRKASRRSFMYITLIASTNMFSFVRVSTCTHVSIVSCYGFEPFLIRTMISNKKSCRAWRCACLAHAFKKSTFTWSKR